MDARKRVMNERTPVTTAGMEHVRAHPVIPPTMHRIPATGSGEADHNTRELQQGGGWEEGVVGTCLNSAYHFLVFSTPGEEETNGGVKGLVVAMRLW